MVRRPEDIAFKLVWRRSTTLGGTDDKQCNRQILSMAVDTTTVSRTPNRQVRRAGNEDAVHHYEKTTDSGKTSSSGPNDFSHKVECNSDDGDPDIITNRQYEQRLQDKYRSIRLLNRPTIPRHICRRI